MAPRLVHAIVDGDGVVVPTEPSVTHEVISTETAETMQAMMHQVVCRGTGKRAQQGITGFSVAGKTGTGLKAQPNGGYLDEQNSNDETTPETPLWHCGSYRPN